MTMPSVSKDTSKPVDILRYTLLPKEKAKPVTIYYKMIPNENADVPIRTFIHLYTPWNQSKGPKGPDILTVLYRIRGDLRPYSIGELKPLWNLTEALIAQYENHKAASPKTRTKKKKPSVKVAQQAIKEVR
jgi:hypothetical protein